jgi:hypothetical protein
MRVVGTCDYLLETAHPDLTLAGRTLRELIAKDEQENQTALRIPLPDSADAPAAMFDEDE